MDDMEPRRESRMSAAKAGRRKFLTAKPCRFCGDLTRYTSCGNCITCKLQQGREYQLEIRRTLAAKG
jgi:hypothetical protein